MRRNLCDRMHLCGGCRNATQNMLTCFRNRTFNANVDIRLNWLIHLHRFDSLYGFALFLLIGTVLKWIWFPSKMSLNFIFSHLSFLYNLRGKKKTPWSESASELHRPSDHRLSAKLLPIFCGYRVPHGQRDGSLRPYSRFSIQEPLLFYQVAHQLYSRNWVDPVPDPLVLCSGSAGNRTRASGSVAENSDH
jgi:hypothetical protein